MDKMKNMIFNASYADHIGRYVVSISDGAYPGNDARGYVLSEFSVEQHLYGRKLGFIDPFFI